jgi:hypothetical protein
MVGLLILIGIGKWTGGRITRPPVPSEGQQQGRPQHEAIMQQASATAPGLEARTEAGARHAVAATSLLMSFMIILQMVC